VYSAHPLRLLRALGHLSLVVCCLGLIGCGEEEAGSLEIDTVLESEFTDINPQSSDLLRQLVDAYLQQIEIDFNTVTSKLMQLQSAIDIFLASPNTETMDVARSVWLDTHSAYELTALHRYFTSLIVSEQQSLALLQNQYRLNHWPILPGYIDYVEALADSGIVNDITVTLNGTALRQQHGAFELAEAALGFHVLEFLLWGENQVSGQLRSASDYNQISQLSTAQADSGLDISQLSNNRRREYLRLASQALIDDFQSIQLLWADGDAVFRNRIVSLQSTELLTLLLEASISVLTEEILLRSLYPLLNGDYSSSIQSPYSHSTQNAISAQLYGVEQLLLEVKTNSGATLDSILVNLSVDFEELFYQSFDATKECLVLLYSTLAPPTEPGASLQTEFEIVECINLLSNMIDSLEQIEISLTDSI